MMAPRLIELHRVLKPTGSIYLHCDPAASHYLKMVMDAVFGPMNFRNEIIWQRTTAHSNIYKSFGRLHDTILFYIKKDENTTWNVRYTDYSEEHIEKSYRYIENGTGRRYARRDLTASMSRASSGQLYEWKGIRPPETRCWAYTKDNMEEFEKAGRIVYSKKGYPRLKVYLDEMPGVPLQDIGIDIRPVQSQSRERLDYPTQKPEALLERIIEASSNKGDVVLDPFCGCGTAIVAAQKLKRPWIGIDVTQAAMVVIKKRLNDTFGEKVSFEVIGEPVSVADAKVLAEQEPYQFQWWALGLISARPVEQKKGADKGVDGRLYFHDEAGTKAKTKQIIISVKSGEKVTVSQLRDLRGVIDREDAEIGVLISMANPTRDMRKEAASAGFYKSAWGKHPRLQLLTIEELLSGKGIDYPPSEQVNVTLKRAPKAKSGTTVTQPQLFHKEGKQPAEN
ncbi:MAG: restriction endonuclease [Sedimentisphaerales bacterium]|nr:restriction endonuclease [Sedimentisphaerales bacterium]